MVNLLLKFLSGVGVFLFAIYTIDNAFGNEIKVSSKTEKYIAKPAVSFGLGLISAAITQSSSAINSILTTLRDKDRVKEKATWFAVAGSNVGTTATAYLAVMQNASIGAFFACLVFFSTLSMMLIKDDKIKRAAMLVSGFSLIFVSFSIIGKTVPELVNILNLDFLTAKNPFIPFFISLFLTALCQSSSLISVIIISFAKLNVLSLTNAIFMIMAANIGTCSTIFLVSIGKSKKSFRVAAFNFIFNVVPTAVFILMYYTKMLNWFFVLNVAMDTKIAMFHTIFNLGACIMICPFIGWMSPDGKENVSDDTKFTNKNTARKKVLYGRKMKVRSIE